MIFTINIQILKHFNSLTHLMPLHTRLIQQAYIALEVEKRLRAWRPALTTQHLQKLPGLQENLPQKEKNQEKKQTILCEDLGVQMRRIVMHSWCYPRLHQSQTYKQRPVIPATWEATLGEMQVQEQPWLQSDFEVNQWYVIRTFHRKK